MTPVAPVDGGAMLAAHGRWLRAVVRARLGEDQAVDEVWQDVALAILSRRGGWIPPDCAEAWLYRLAARQVLQHRRRCGRRRKLVDRYAASRRAAGEAASPDPLGWLLLDERRALVRAAMGRLAPRDAEILTLKYAEGWTCRDLARRLGVGPSAIEARLHRARGRLRDELSASHAIEVSG